MGALWRTHIALPDQRNGFNASPGICPALFHPCSTLFHQFGATRLAYGPKRPFLAVLDPVWPYIWPKWLEQECSPLEQVNPHQNEAENIIGCHGKPTSKKPPSPTHCGPCFSTNLFLVDCFQNRCSNPKTNCRFSWLFRWRYSNAADVTKGSTLTLLAHKS